VRTPSGEVGKPLSLLTFHIHGFEMYGWWMGLFQATICCNNLHFLHQRCQ
jgi:hypothetical protein